MNITYDNDTLPLQLFTGTSLSPVMTPTNNDNANFNLQLKYFAELNYTVAEIIQLALRANFSNMELLSTHPEAIQWEWQKIPVFEGTVRLFF